MADTIKKQSVMLQGSKLTGATNSYRKVNPVVAAVATKLVRDSRTVTGRRNYDGSPLPRLETLYGASEQITANINDIENIFEVLPETERCEMIITSCVLSPDDMKTIDLRYECETSNIPAAILAAQLDIMEEYCDKSYKIKKLLPKILSNALFKTGSYPIMCIPESSLDNLINHDNRFGLESLSGIQTSLQPLGILGDNNATLAMRNKERTGPVRFSMESLLSGSNDTVMTNNKILTGLSVTDNPLVARLPALQETITQRRVLEAYSKSTSMGLEALDSKHRLTDMAQKLYTRRRHRKEEMVQIYTQDQQKRNSVGHALTIDLASDAVIPVGNPSDMSEHFGYFVLLDQYGNPLSNSQDSLYSQQLNQRLAKNKSEASGVLADIQTSLYGKCEGCDAEYAGDMFGVFADFVERDLLQRFDNGAMSGRAVQIARPDQVYRMMLARILANKHTQVLYVPRELLTYFAFDYNKRGIGKSLTDGTKILASIRALLLFATTRSAVRAAVGHKTLNLAIDPEVQDVQKLAQQMVHEYIRVNNGNYPLGTSDPNDIMSYMEQAGLTVNIENHPGYPDVKATVESTQSAVQQIDPELDRELRNRHISRYGLPPEVVDSSTGVDFAATIRTSNVFLDKQMTQIKESLCDQVSEHVRMLAVNSGTIMSGLFDAINENEHLIPADYKVGDSWKADMVIEFLDNFTVNLPDSNNTKLETQLQKLTIYQQVLDTVFNVFVTPEILMAMDPSNDPESSAAAITIMKQHFLREFIISEGILPEVSDVLTWPGDEDNPAYNFMKVQTGYMEALGNTLTELMANIKERRAKQNPDKVDNDAGSDWGSTSTGGSSWGEQTQDDPFNTDVQKTPESTVDEPTFDDENQTPGEGNNLKDTFNDV